MTLFLPLFISPKPYLSHHTKRYYFPKGRTPSLDITSNTALGEHRKRRAKHRHEEREAERITNAETRWKRERHGEKYIYTVTGAYRSTPAPPSLCLACSLACPLTHPSGTKRWGRGGANWLTHIYKGRVQHRHTQFNIRCVMLQDSLTTYIIIR